MLANWLKTSILMAAILALFGAIGAMVGGKTGMLLALLFGGTMNFFAYWYSDKMVLKMYKARQVDETSAPQFYGMVRELAQRAGLPMPKVYLIDEAQPNAFATGRNPDNAAVAATTGILQLLSAREIRGVMAHELAHVAHRDILISTISATMAGAISALANFAMFFGGRDSEGRSNPLAGILVALLAPLAASLIQMAISRAREFEADRGGEVQAVGAGGEGRIPGEGDATGTGLRCERDGGARGRKQPALECAGGGERGGVLRRGVLGGYKGERGVAGDEVETRRPGDEGEGMLEAAFGQARRRLLGSVGAAHEIAHLGVDVVAGSQRDIGRLDAVAAVERRAVEAGGAEGPAAARGDGEALGRGEAVVIGVALQEDRVLRRRRVGHDTGDGGIGEREALEGRLGKIEERDGQRAAGRGLGGPGILDAVGHAGASES